MKDIRDVVVVGGGVAGLTAGLFAARYGRSTLIIERSIPGGQIVNAERVENYPGFPGGAGADLAALIGEQTADAGAEFAFDEVTGLEQSGAHYVVLTRTGGFRSRTVIIAGGSRRREIGVDGEAKLRGRGVSECATCDGALFDGQIVGVVGGGDTALDEALSLTKYASRVMLFLRGRTFRAQKILQERAATNGGIEVWHNTVLDEILGEDRVVAVKIRDVLTGETSRVDLSGLFMCAGLDPNTAYLKGRVALDRAGHIPTDIWMRTELPGVFAVGDTRQNSGAQTICSAGDGATAAIGAHRYMNGDPWPPPQKVEGSTGSVGSSGG
jgi:thioredoxin reductase (NADPH)